MTVFKFLQANIELKKEEPILFFDGVCGLCNFFVDFLMQKDQHKIFKFSSLQGTTAEKLLDKKQTSKLDTLVIHCQGVTKEKSEAVFFVLKTIGGPLKLITIFNLLPTDFLNFIYDQIAKNRYRIFSQRQDCRLPTKEERGRFLP